MVCEKCGYQDKKETKKFDKVLCSLCSIFSPLNEKDFENYINEKIDWKSLETFRKYGQTTGQNQKKGMGEKAKQGKLVTRAPMGYSLQEGVLVPNELSSKVHSMFKTFLEKDYSLNSMSKHYGVSINGLKKILKNRTYLGEIKFDGQLHKAGHKPIISAEIFYAVQRKLIEKSKKKKLSN
jgi:hypothetical protein